MADVLDTANEWLVDQVLRYRSRTVKYRRGGSEASVPAVTGRSIFRIDTGYGLFEHVVTQDYLIAVASLRAAGIDEPRVGDRIVDGDAVFEVLSLGNEPHYKTDPYLRVHRIHTKRVESTS